MGLSPSISISSLVILLYVLPKGSGNYVRTLKSYSGKERCEANGTDERNESTDERARMGHHDSLFNLLRKKLSLKFISS